MSATSNSGNPGSSAGPTSASLRKPVRCLVVQLARIGDTLQSLMALRAAKQLYPELEIHFVAREKFAAAAQRVPWIQNVIPLPTDRILGPVLSGEKSDTEALADLARWLSPLVGNPWDFVVNWSFSDASSFLTALLPGRVKLGYTRRRDTSFACADGWSHYIQAIVQGGVPQNIHLTDILTTQLLTALQIHVGEPANEGSSPVTSKSFFALEMGDPGYAAGPLGGSIWRDQASKWIGIQLGASQENKIVQPEDWAAVASYILRRNSDCAIVILGGKEDKQRATRFMTALKASCPEGIDHKRLVSLVGETDFDLWASAVGRCSWLFGADTAAIHLASVLGTRVLNASVGPVRWAETGPYGNGHYVVSGKVSAEAIYSAWSYAASEWSHRRQHSLESHAGFLGMGESLREARVHRSRIRNTSDGGGVVYESVTPNLIDLDGWTSSVMGHIARAWYCGWVPPVGQELKREAVTPALLRSIRELEESSQILSKICDQASTTALWLTKKSSSLRSDKVMGVIEREELQQLGAKLLELDHLADRLGRTHSPLKAFSQMSKVLMHNLRSDQLSDLGRESADCYRQLKEGVTHFRDWVRYTLNLARPRAIITTEEKSQ